MHGHDVWWTGLQTAPSPLHSVPETKGSMNIDNVVFGSHSADMFGDSLRKFDRAKPIGPLLLGKHVLEKHGLYAVSLLGKLFCQIVNNSSYPGFRLPRHPRYHQNA